MCENKNSSNKPKNLVFIGNVMALQKPVGLGPISTAKQVGMQWTLT